MEERKEKKNDVEKGSLTGWESVLEMTLERYLPGCFPPNVSSWLWEREFCAYTWVWDMTPCQWASSGRLRLLKSLQRVPGKLFHFVKLNVPNTWDAPSFFFFGYNKAKQQDFIHRSKKISRCSLISVLNYTSWNTVKSNIWVSVKLRLPISIITHYKSGQESSTSLVLRRLIFKGIQLDGLLLRVVGAVWG